MDFIISTSTPWLKRQVRRRSIGGWVLGGRLRVNFFNVYKITFPKLALSGGGPHAGFDHDSRGHQICRTKNNGLCLGGRLGWRDVRWHGGQVFPGEVVVTNFSMMANGTWLLKVATPIPPYY